MLILKKSFKRDEGLFMLIKEAGYKEVSKGTHLYETNKEFFKVCETKTEKTTRINCQN